MTFLTDLDDLSRVLLSLIFIAVAALISRWQRGDLENDLLIAAVRAFIQLILIGYALDLIFEADHPFFTLLILLIMTTIAAQTTATRAKQTPNARMIAAASIGGGSFLTILVLLLLGVFQFTPQDIIPIGGMIIGNSMTTAALMMTRFSQDLIKQRDEIETMLALGADSRQASLPQWQNNLRAAMLPIIDTTKTVGLIKLPGAMTGMILAGASPLEAVQLQIIVMYMLVGATAFTGLGAAYLTYRQFFTRSHQLRWVAEKSK